MLSTTLSICYNFPSSRQAIHFVRVLVLRTVRFVSFGKCFRLVGTGKGAERK